MQTPEPLPDTSMAENKHDDKIINTSSREENNNETNNNINPLDIGKLLHGCNHYRRRCKIRAPCCNQIFFCRHCHNEATSVLINHKERHEIVRQDIKHVICELCNTEQEVAQICTNCGAKMGEYFCGICKFYDDDISKQQFHCNGCGICRLGGVTNFFHCQKCGSCYDARSRGNHACVENSMKNHCPICYEFLFDSMKSATTMNCGHIVHVECQDEMTKQNHYRCPICSKSMTALSNTWQRLDQEIEATTMPEEYRYEISILCNDCNNTSKASFHIIGHKCSHCKSYNTRRIETATNGSC